MKQFRLSERLRLQVELALTRGTNEALLRRQEARARELGLSGAEVDAARRGGAYDVRAAAAVALACAARDATPTALEQARRRAARSGFDEAGLAGIEALARQPLPLE